MDRKDFFRKEWEDQIRLMERSPLVRTAWRACVRTRLVWAVVKAECRKTARGKCQVVVVADDAAHFLVLDEEDAASMFSYLKRTRFMRRPDIRQRVVYVAR